MNPVQTLIESIQPVDDALRGPLQAHLDDLTKPQGSLGRLETLALRYGLARGTSRPVMGRKRIVCCAGDHGVTAEGVSAFPAEVTVQMVANMLAGGAAINVLAAHAGADLEIVDAGVNADLGAMKGLLDYKVRRGTRNLLNEPAMTVAETRQAIAAGIDRARTAAGEGVTLLGTGEMGIGNTTPSTALICAFFDLQPADVTGRGTGLADDALAHKVQVVEKALARHRDRIGDPLETLAALGGFEIAALCGLVLGAAAHRIPVVVDGYISSAAAVAALRMQPLVRDYLFFSHLSAERGHAQLVQRLDVRPVLDLDLRLGEGTGAALAMTLIEAAVKVYNGMATFGSAGVSQQA